MSTNDCSNGPVERIGTLLEQLRTEFQQHDEALIRMDTHKIEQHLAAEQIIREELSTLRAQVATLPAGIVECAVNLRRALHTHAALIAKSRASLIMLRNTYSACHQHYPEQECRAQTHA